MYLNLKKKYPTTVLIPTADILFVQLAHIFRTREYYHDVDEQLMPTNPLSLDRGIIELFTECIKGTAHLWETEYLCPYLPPGYEVTDWIYWKEATEDEDEPQYILPPSYITVIGPRPPTVSNLEGKLSLTVEDIINDVKWFPELQRSFYKLETRSWGLTYNKNAKYVRLYKTYMRYLYLVAKHPQFRGDLAPPVTIDVMWHAHMSLPVMYKADTTRICGHILEHQPWKSSKEFLPILVDSPINCLWKEEFGTTIDEDHIYS